MKTTDLFEFIHNQVFDQEFLEKANKVDKYANGVQVMGNEDVKKIALGVSCNADFLSKAAKSEADVCIFHHGMNLSDIYNSRLNKSTNQQLKIAFENNLTIAGYHYALDAHTEIGNNAQIIKMLGANKLDEPYFDGWGWVAEFEQPKFVQDLAQECSKLFKHDVFMVLSGPEKIKRLGVCSGAAIPHSKDILEIIEKKLDLHLTGVITESDPALAKENGFNYFSCGHYATESIGVKALGERIKQQFPELEVEFIDVWNEL